MRTRASRPRPYRVAALGSTRKHYFASSKAAIAFARQQVHGAWTDQYWTVWDNTTNTLVCRVGRDGKVTWNRDR